MMRLLFPALGLGLALGCSDADPLSYAPTLDGVSADADARLDLVDRDSALAGASDWESAAPGEALDPATGGQAFALEVDGSEISSLEAEATGSGSYSHVTTGAVAVVAADLVALGVVGPPAVAIGIASEGEISQLADNVWYAENSASFGGQQVTAHWTVAWVGVGWLAEMRISDDSGRYDHTLWFNGFLAYGGGLGWWDLYRETGELAGVVEWLGDGENLEFGIAVASGDYAGDWMLYTDVEDTHRIDVWSESLQDSSWVEVLPDRSGEVRLPEYNGGEPGCWGPDLVDTPCD